IPACTADVAFDAEAGRGNHDIGTGDADIGDVRRQAAATVGHVTGLSRRCAVDHHAPVAAFCQTIDRCEGHRTVAVSVVPDDRFVNQQLPDYVDAVGGAADRAADAEGVRCGGVR